jgi:formate dehydrogenase major subunit
VEMVALPWHFGFAGLITGGPDKRQNYACNQLTPTVGDANTMIPEYKVFLVDVQKV